MSEARTKLIVALDVETADEARRLVSLLRGRVGMFKIGLQLFTVAGPSLVRELIECGEKVFLDLKFHDIPNTVAAASLEATRLGVSMFNIHASAGGIALRKAADAVFECATSEGIPRPTVLGITVLTSSNDTTLKEIGIENDTEHMVARLARLTANNGLDGVVASAREVAIVRQAVARDNFVVVTPGVRPTGSSSDDQSRVMSPRAAIAAGADYLVLGRPILNATDPQKAVEQVIGEMQTAAASRTV